MTQRVLGDLALVDVAHDDRDAGGAAIGIRDCRCTQRNVDPPPIFGEAYRFVGRHDAALVEQLVVAAEFACTLLWDDDRNLSSDDLRCRIAQESLRADVPRLDPAVQ